MWNYNFFFGFIDAWNEDMGPVSMIHGFWFALRALPASLLVLNFSVLMSFRHE